ncbi:MAG: hypothetical protein ACLU30_04130 [Odoribacter splanchnicus]
MTVVIGKGTSLGGYWSLSLLFSSKEPIRNRSLLPASIPESRLNLLQIIPCMGRTTKIVSVHPVRATGKIYYSLLLKNIIFQLAFLLREKGK